jgi:hypothetical protein
MSASAAEVARTRVDIRSLFRPRSYVAGPLCEMPASERLFSDKRPGPANSVAVAGLLVPLQR